MAMGELCREDIRQLGDLGSETKNPIRCFPKSHPMLLTSLKALSGVAENPTLCVPLHFVSFGKSGSLFLRREGGQHFWWPFSILDERT